MSGLALRPPRRLASVPEGQSIVVRHEAPGKGGEMDPPRRARGEPATQDISASFRQGAVRLVPQGLNFQTVELQGIFSLEEPPRARARAKRLAAKAGQHAERHYLLFRSEELFWNFPEHATKRRRVV
jgi:hypothetical protein